MNRLAVLLLLFLPSCRLVLQPGQTFERNEPYLKCSLLQYWKRGTTYYWTKEVRQGLLGVSTPTGKAKTRQIVVVNSDGVIERVDRLGKDRCEWGNRLREDTVWSDHAIHSIASGRPMRGLTVEQMLVGWGRPCYRTNYRCVKQPWEIEPDSVMYYPYYNSDVWLEGRRVKKISRARHGRFWKWDQWPNR